jgi:hypothetical protein
MLRIATGLLCLFFVLPSAASAEKRVALVIGNGAYTKVPKLENPKNDATAIEAMLKAAGFDTVVRANDLGAAAMRRALRDFSDTSLDADVAVVFYAGHGMEVGGINYLIPTDAVLERDIDAQDEAVSLDRVSQILEPAKRLRLVILDACRDNPFVRSMRRTVATRAIRSGYGEIDERSLPPNTLIAYAQRAGATAEDGAGANSPYTTALLKHLPTPGLDIELALRRVRDDVLKLTRNRQEPFKYGSLGGAEIALVAVKPSPIATTDERLWGAIKDSGVAGLIEDFLKRFPASPRAAEARGKLEALERDRLAQEQAERAKREQAQREQIEERERVAQERWERERLVREQLAREQLARAQREQAEREQREREQSAQEQQAERERLAREQAGREGAQQQVSASPAAKAQTAMLTPPSEPVPATSASRPVLAGGTLVQEIKKELKRVGCHAGKLDDQWTTSDTKVSVQKFAKFAKLPSVPSEPVVDFLDAIREKSGRVCPLECGALEIEMNGVCVPRKCGPGQKLDRKGQCINISGPISSQSVQDQSSPRANTGEKDWNQVATDCVAKHGWHTTKDGKHRDWTKAARDCVSAARSGR